MSDREGILDMICIDSWELEEGEIEENEEKSTETITGCSEERQREKGEETREETKREIKREKCLEEERQEIDRKKEKGSEDDKQERERKREKFSKEERKQIERKRVKGSEDERQERKRKREEETQEKEKKREKCSEEETQEREKKREKPSEEGKQERKRDHKKRKRNDSNKDKHRTNCKRRKHHHSSDGHTSRKANGNKEMAAQVQKRICSAGGNLGMEKLCSSLGLSVEQAESFVAEEEGNSVMMRMEGGEKMLVTRSALRVCTDKMQECEGDCGKLHLCRYHVLDSCTRTPCNFSHEITSGQNLRVLQGYHLEALDIEELRHLLLQNDPSFLPEICKHYNCGNGLYGACNFQTDCQKLHICQYYLKGECRYQFRCKRSHHLQGLDTLSKLKKWGMGDRWLTSLEQIYRNASVLRDIQLSVPKKRPMPVAKKRSLPVAKKEVPFAGSTDQSPNTLDQSEEICLYYIRKNCIFKDKCMKDHYHLPYRWQVQRAGGWEDMDDMESIEEAYCNISSVYHLFKPWAVDLNFDAMIYKSCKVRRLSTPSLASKPPHYILTTDWLWYWKDEYNRWNEYGKQGSSSTQAVSDICSSDMEKAFLLDKNATINFKAGSQTYELRLKDMVQKNLGSSTERKVCRRPKFVSKEEVKNKKSGKTKSQAETTLIPSHWDTDQLPDLGFKLVKLDSTSAEYTKVKDLFHNTLRTVSILSIERIQNLSLWEVFLWQREQMKKQNGGKDVEERQLFHGTSDTFIDAICQQNFDWRICGAHGTMYGKGSYFAREASYSHTYTNYRVNQSRVMFLARVLVGDFTAGNPSHLRPPAKNPLTPSCFYDSCVDSISCPSIFVIFEKHQIYPEYLIKYL
ncbi:protein mono-ADP-ribosyltransferase PARP12 isoform X2 [Xenopus laevis]|uniref:Protein mono-ADP-ribosyltransferase PARP12 isoform X2 n=1 Tax=Xenopus laevis TaxID=8355 RepID=A0A8J0U4E4_XENLA|nr:protein mono-ADP-ribosyltransferase PARP12 isoform X2 [Xenopus laevis]OCT58186.1 hypothetical protein XELAEV_18002515mg [Xenopus laevis]